MKIQSQAFGLQALYPGYMTLKPNNNKTYSVLKTSQVLSPGNPGIPEKGVNKMEFRGGSTWPIRFAINSRGEITIVQYVPTS